MKQAGKNCFANCIAIGLIKGIYIIAKQRSTSLGKLISDDRNIKK